MRNRHRLKSIYVCVLLAMASPAVSANPLDPTVISGQASFAATGNTLTITNTPGAIINWQGFSIGANEITRFNQQSASSAVLNRVISSNPSSILGTLQSNGRVFLINPNGIVFGAGAVVDVAGLVASTLNLSDADFFAGRNSFTQIPGAANVSNAGNITASGDGQTGGQIFLIAPNVENTGVITAPNGEILLAAGHSVDLVDTANPNLRVNITAPAGDATNVGQLIASSGSLGLFGTVVRNSGTVSADSAMLQGGKIVFKASLRAEVGGTVSANGTSGGSVDISAAHSLDANAPGVVIHTGSVQANGTAGVGGSVGVSADSILSTAAINVDGITAGGTISVQAANRALSTSSAQYTANSTQGQGGDILVSANGSNYTSGSYSTTGITGGNLTLAGNEIKLAGAQLDASGTNGGGNIHVGGLMHGAAGFTVQGITLSNATNVLTNSAATLKADALQTGHGGEVVLWSDQAMRFTGSISARGGALGGNGGMAEVSGLTSLGYGGLTNLSAAYGLNGTLLLDPRNITIAPGSGASPFMEIFDPTPGAGEGFGGLQNLVLSSGNIVVASPYDDAFGLDSGAVHLYSSTGTLLSTLVGSAAGDKVGGVTQGGWVGPADSGGLTALGNGNVIVSSNNWNGTFGAVTWMNGATGALSDGATGGTVAATNSLVGSTTGDKVGTYTVGIYDLSGIHELASNNVVIQSSNWGGAGVAANALGAVTWMSGTTGRLSNTLNGGIVSSANSLVGSVVGDKVGMNTVGANDQTGLTLLVGGNLLIASNNWNGLRGAFTWMSGATGLLSDGVSTGGVVSATNSLVGLQAGEGVGGSHIELSNNNLVIWTQGWGLNSRGAITWMNGATGALSDGTNGGVVSSANSLVGGAASDLVGQGYSMEVTNGTYLNYVVHSKFWGGAGVPTNALGAVTWINGATGLLSDGTAGGIVSASNSLIGSLTGDRIGTLTFSSGGFPNDQTGLLHVGNGNLVIASNNWDNGAATDAGAVTWMNGATGRLSNNANGGVITATNSLVGSTAGDRLGTAVPSYGIYEFLGLTVLGNGNLIISSNYWDNGAATDAGAVTWMSGSTGLLSDGVSTGGAVTASNSVVGSTANDKVGGGHYNQNTVVELPGNGNLVIGSPTWDNGAATDAGAVTWMNGASGLLSDGVSAGGAVSSLNSLIGFSSGDAVGTTSNFWMLTSYYFAPQVLANGNLMVASNNWTARNGALTWLNGATGKLADGSNGGIVSGANSLLGSTPEDLSSSTLNQLLNGNLLITNQTWDNGANVDAGAMTWMDATTGALSDGTLGGAVTLANSLVSATGGSNLGSGGVTQLGNGNVVIASPSWANGAVAGAGAVTWMNSANGRLSDASTGGAVSATNSLIGSTANDNVGSNGVTVVTDYSTYWNYVVQSSGWDNVAATAVDAGAITWMNGVTGKTFDTVGTISSANSIVGSTAGDAIGFNGWSANSVLLLGNGNVAFASSSWNGGMGAVTWMKGLDGKLADNTNGGAVSAANSLVGSNQTLLALPYTQGDQIGSGGVTLISDYSTYWNYAVRSPNWTSGAATGAGAVTLGNGATGTVGVVSAGNSLVGDVTGDAIGSGGIRLLGNGHFVVSSPDWRSGGTMYAGLGAVTWVNGQTGALSNGSIGGVVGSTNSLVGSTSGDKVGSLDPFAGTTGALIGINVFGNSNLLIRSQAWSGGVSALSWMNGATGRLAGGATGGAVSATNSLLGSTVGDNLGSGEVGVTQLLVNGNWVITSANWGNASDWGAATWMNSTNGQLADGTFGGALSAANSQVGSVTTPGWIDFFCDCGTNGTAGGIKALSDGNYVAYWQNFTPDVGAVTWGNGAAGSVGALTSSNSLFEFVNPVQEMPGSPGKVLVGSKTANGGAGAVYVLGGSTSVMNSNLFFATSPGADAVVGADWISSTLNTTNVVLQANNDITQSVGAAINSTGTGNLTLQAGRSVILKDGISIGGALSITANDAGITAPEKAAIAANRSLGAAIIETSGLSASSITLSNTGGDIMLGGNISKAGAALGALNVMAANNILLKGTASGAAANISSQTGALDVSLRSDFDGVGGGAIYLDAGSSINSNGGNITMGGMPSVGRAIGNGTVTGGITFDSGIYVLGNITAGAGNVTMLGEGANNNFADGITFAGGTLSSNGIVNIDGIAHGYSSNSGTPLYTPVGPNWFAAGVDFVNAGTRLTTQTGTVTVTGLNTAPNADPLYYRADGIMVETGTVVQTTGTGTLTFNGTANSLNTSWGVGVFGGTIQTTAAGGGAITLKGTNAGNADGGVVLMGGHVLSSGGAILMEGSSAGGDSIGIASGSTIGGANAGNITLVAHEKFVNAETGNPITTAGRWLIYSPNSGVTTLGSIAAGFKRYNCTYASGCLTAGTTIPVAGNGLMYAIAPTLTVNANAASKIYGSADPAYTHVVAAGLIDGDLANTPDVLAGALGRTIATGESVAGGPYAIDQGTLYSPMGYAITTYNPASLTVTPAPLTVIANSTSKILNTTDPLLTYTVSGLQFLDTASTTGSLSRVPGETVGTYQINQGSLALSLALIGPGGNYYMLNYVPANFTILVPTVIDEIVNTGLMFGPDTGSARSTSSKDEEDKAKEEILAVEDTKPIDGTAGQPLPVCN